LKINDIPSLKREKKDNGGRREKHAVEMLCYAAAEAKSRVMIIASMAMKF